MKPSTEKPALSHGEQTIKRALTRSAGVLLVMLVIAAGIYLAEQDSPPPPEPPAAVVAGPAQTAAAPSDQPPSVHFTDITSAAGIDFIHSNGAQGDRLIPETIGSGVAFFDYDQDGDQDLFLVNFNHWQQDDTPTPTQALYRNDGHGHFEDISAAAGLAIPAYGMGVAIADYDGDGWPDLYLTTLGKNRLFHNDNGHFSEVTDTAGVAGGERDWSTGATFIDIDNDGDLDLFVVNYVKWSRNIDLTIDFRLAGLGRAYGAPNNFNGSDNVLYRNNGDGTFSDISAAAGIQVHDPISGLPIGKGLGLTATDYNQDGRIDLLVANDTVRNFLYHNLGDGRFEEIGAFEGIAYDRQGKATGGMGIDIARFRNDQELGVLIGNFANEMSSLYVTANGQPPFVDEAVIEGLGPASRLALTFGVLFFDYDLDGRLDLLQANGHLESEINKVQPSQHYAQPAQLFWNCGDTCQSSFQLVTDPGDLSQPMVGRGAAWADIDGDGDLDVVITQNGRTAKLFRNDQHSGHHWLRLKLVGRAPNHDAIGASVTLKSNRSSQYRELLPDRSYLSQMELPLSFGLGDSDRVDSLEIRWPDGTQQTLTPQRVDQTLTLRQPEPAR